MARDAAGGVGGAEKGAMTPREYLAKVAALKQHVVFTTAPGARYFDPRVVLNLFERYANVRDGLRSEYPALFGDLQVRPEPEPSGTTDFEGRGYITDGALFVLLGDLDYCETLLEKLPEPTIPSLAVTREGVFFAGQYFDALTRITDILTRAKSDVVLIDGYIDASVLKLFGSKPRNVSIRILTKSTSNTSLLQATATAFNKQHSGLAIRVSAAFHDRFVIIDDAEFYHFGASIKDAGTRGFMFSHIEEPAVISALRAKFAAEWASASLVV